MKRALLAAIVAAAMSIAPAAYAKSSHSSHSYANRSHATRTYHSRAYPGVRRDARGRIARSGEAKDQFRKSHPCPATGKRYGACPGYVIDHIHALKHGGADAPYNMQWQTRAAAKAKDKWE